ncbi:histidine-type phosphatase [Nocardia sp. NPDC051570]|uniref:histidine-type phosphatase n=1 Tax=Nocardia sp. NPDC051570 TaxID=3364324 RepID=UPI0037BBF41C
MSTAWVKVVTAIVVLAGALPGLASAEPPPDNPGPLAVSYGTKNPYAAQQDPATYQPPPEGFRPVFTEHVARHGSRALSKGTDDELALRIWEQAAGENALTDAGRRFGDDVRSLHTATTTLGYGNLTERGEREHQGLATRVYQRLPDLFDRIAANKEHIAVVTSGKDRAVDSAQVFTDALAAADPAVTASIDPARTDRNLLYFHKTDAAYQNYLDNDPRLPRTLHDITDQPRTHQVARNVLGRIFTSAFVDRLATGTYDFVADGKHVTDEVGAVRVIYDLYAIAPAMSAEGTWQFDRIIDGENAQWLGYLSDAAEFYRKGPAFAGDDITYRMANVLLDDLFAKLEAKRAGTSDLGAEFRFTHAEEIIPLAVLMKLPGSTRATPPDQPFTYTGNPWRGALVAPMAANIQWDMYQRGDDYIVRMLYNEQQTAFESGCAPINPGSYFYRVDELERCFGRHAAS